MNEKFKHLSIGLPEDILRTKLYGDFNGAIKLIDMRLAGNIPEAQRDCLIVEREMISRLKNDYPYDMNSALKKINEAVADFTEEEFLEYRDQNKIDWIYIDGEPRYFSRFYQTLLKVYPDFAKRAGIKQKSEDENELNVVMAEMKKNGRCGYNLRLRASVRVKDEAFAPDSEYTVHIPIPKPARNTCNIKIHSSSPGGYIAPEDAPQRTICFKQKLAVNREFFVEYSYDSIVEYTDTAALTPDAIQPGFDTQEQQPHIVFTPYIKALAEELTRGKTTALEKARAFYDFITLKFNYSYMREYFGLENIAENGARSLRGDCGVQALLFITLLRCAGIPARWQSGLNAGPETAGAHDWSEFYIAPYGWLFADPSYGGGANRNGNEERRQYYFGNLDPYRMVANSDFYREFDPQKKFWRADPYDNQTGEIETEARGLLYTEYERKQTVISCTKIV